LPLDFKNVIANLTASQVAKILADYSFEKLRSLFPGRQYLSFEERVVSDFGRSLAEINILNYTEKVWGLPCSQISADWAKQRIKDLSLFEVAKKLILRSSRGPKTLIDEFYYPDQGTELIYERIAERLTLDTHTTFELQSYPLALNHDNERITEIVIQTPAGLRTISNPEYVVSSIPITELVTLLKPSAPPEVIEASRWLKFRSHTSLFLTIHKQSLFKDQWIYFPEKQIPFGRIMEPKNFSARLSPPGFTSLLIEFFCWENDAVWTATANDLLHMSIDWLERMDFLRRADIINAFVHREKYAYPVYDLQYKEHLGVITAYLRRLVNLFCVGRSGMFRYNNQDHALEMGIMAAHSIIENKRYDIDTIGEEQEYFEKGFSPSDE
jgi:protoporphyrinogen oxidase